jgi:hypothetical protein
MVKRRSLTPTTGTTAATGVHATRRGSGGARREATTRVLLRGEGSEITGWALNLSRGGIRLEDKVELGQEFEIALEEPEAEAPSGSSRPGRVVWVQEEKDGMVVGLEFLDGDGPGPGPPDAPPKNM